MSKVRVYEVAKQLGIDEQAALALLQQQGAPVRNRLSAVEQDVADRAKRALERSKAASVVERPSASMAAPRTPPSRCVVNGSISATGKSPPVFASASSQVSVIP